MPCELAETAPEGREGIMAESNGLVSRLPCGRLHEPRIDNPLVRPQGNLVGEQTSFLGQKPGCSEQRLRAK